MVKTAVLLDQFCVRASRWAESDLTQKASVQRGQQSARCLTPIDIEPCHISGDHRSYEKVTLGKGWEDTVPGTSESPQQTYFWELKDFELVLFLSPGLLFTYDSYPADSCRVGSIHFFVARAGPCYLAGSAKVGILPYIRELTSLRNCQSEEPHRQRPHVPCGWEGCTGWGSGLRRLCSQRGGEGRSADP